MPKRLTDQERALRAAQKGGGLPSKYGNKRAEAHDGSTFASKKERDRYNELDLLRRAGYITKLDLQVRYPLVVKKVRIGVYVADFVYVEKDKVGRVVEDVKGFRTPLYQMKKRLMKALYGVEIRES